MLVMFQVEETSAVLVRLTFIHQSPAQGLNDTSVSRPPADVPSRVIVMTVPARTSAQSGSWVKAISPCAALPSPYHTSVPLGIGAGVVVDEPPAATSHWSFQPRRSAWSRVTTSSIQSPPLPMRRPKNVSWSVAQGSPAGPTPQRSVLFSQQSSRTQFHSLRIRSDARQCAEAMNAKAGMTMVFMIVRSGRGQEPDTDVGVEATDCPKHVQSSFTNHEATDPECHLNTILMEP